MVLVVEATAFKVKASLKFDFATKQLAVEVVVKKYESFKELLPQKELVVIQFIEAS